MSVLTPIKPLPPHIGRGTQPNSPASGRAALAAPAEPARLPVKDGTMPVMPAGPMAGGLFNGSLLFGANNINKPHTILNHALKGENPAVDRLNAERAELEAAAKAAGLDPFPVIYHLMNTDKFFQVVARNGFQERFPHWSWGQNYHELVVPHLKGKRKLHEVVTNLNPTRAYLLSSNPIHGQRTLMAHAIARADFYKNNVHFQHTNRRINDLIHAHAERIETYMKQHGRDEVEQFIDKVLSIKDLIETDTTQPQGHINDMSDLGKDGPQRDVLSFLMQHSPVIEPWQRDIISMIRDESYYMLPQQKTQVLGDGWAAYVNKKINTGNPKLADLANLSNEARWIAGNVYMTSQVSVNTYQLGEVILRGIEKKLTEELGDPQKVREAMLDIRKNGDDAWLIENHLTQEMVEELLLYVYGPELKNKQEPGTKLKITSKEFEQIKESLLAQFKNGEVPTIEVVDKDFKRGADDEGGRLLLRHVYEFDLRKDWAEEALKNLEAMWGRPVYLQTKITDKDGGQLDVWMISIDGDVEYFDENFDRVNKNTGKVEAPSRNPRRPRNR